jgi:SRSO17 transposase
MFMKHALVKLRQFSYDSRNRKIDYWRSEPRPEQCLLIEWPVQEKEPTKYWLSNLPATISLRNLVAIAKLRLRRVEAGTGSGPFRRPELARLSSWHATLAIAAYGFLVLERCLFPPSGNAPPLRAGEVVFQLPRVQASYTPRGAAGKNRTA